MGIGIPGPSNSVAGASSQQMPSPAPRPRGPKLKFTPEDGTVISRAYTGKTCRVVRNDWTQHFEEHPEELKKFPEQAFASGAAGANHLGAATGTVVEVRREFMPCGQGVGGFDQLEPAGELVRRMVAEAEAMIERVAALRR